MLIMLLIEAMRRYALCDIICWLICHVTHTRACHCRRRITLLITIERCQLQRHTAAALLRHAATLRHAAADAAAAIDFRRFRLRCHDMATMPPLRHYLPYATPLHELRYDYIS